MLYRKDLFTKGVHNFVHLNLAIALFLAYLVFAISIELAAKNKVCLKKVLAFICICSSPIFCFGLQIACQVVTAILQYLFISVFCWMLSEGVMLYLMLVVVFSTLSKKWWFFMLLGWCEFIRNRNSPTLWTKQSLFLERSS